MRGAAYMRCCYYSLQYSEFRLWPRSLSRGIGPSWVSYSYRRRGAVLRITRTVCKPYPSYLKFSEIDFLFHCRERVREQRGRELPVIELYFEMRMYRQGVEIVACIHHNDHIVIVRLSRVIMGETKVPNEEEGYKYDRMK
jgi:hypothetical protein